MIRLLATLEVKPLVGGTTIGEEGCPTVLAADIRTCFMIGFRG